MLAAILALSAASATQGAPSLPDITVQGSGIYPESLTSSADGSVFVGSLGGIIYRAAPGSRTAEPWIRHSSDNGLLSVFGLLADDRTRTLWVCTAPAALPGGIPNGATAVLRFDLKTGALKDTHPLPQPHGVCDDIALARDGTAFIIDIVSGEIYRLDAHSSTLQLYAKDAALKGVDGIAFGDDGTLYIDNITHNQLTRVERDAQGHFVGLTQLTTSQALAGPDGLRHIAGNRFLLAEGRAGRIDEVTITGDQATIRVLASGLNSPTSVTRIGDTVYAPEGKVQYLMDPKLRGQSPDPFIVRAISLKDSAEHP